MFFIGLKLFVSCDLNQLPSMLDIAVTVKHD